MTNARHQYNLADMLHHVLTGAMQFDVPVQKDRIILGTSNEETCIPGVLTLRDNTGRPETVEAGSNVLAGTEAMIGCARSMLERGNRWKDQFGDGRAGEGIIEILTRYSKRLI